ncbi:glycosyltransferase [Alteromonas sp. 5E99-2]|uniref:glycosyltransferase n=1 Tax=Alteromonas sp. 5E99-2 TaxID=2817683 RepID=UPI001A98EDC4|nr:glycosyltransferase [Alteromonas sp. 5E99-2]MBO1256535.1 glycosyltransferase [Alteromonas sp. 5E99-2]
MANISFIIPHKGRDSMLLQTLESIAQLDKAEHQIDVVLVSQNEKASDAVLAYQQNLQLNVIYNVAGATISSSRNLGVKAAKGDYLAFLDADIDLAHNWLVEMLSTLAKPDIVLASAMQVDSIGAPPLERLRTGLSNATLDERVTFLPGRNLFLTRSVFEQVGGFPEHLITCEDYYFTERVAAIGGLFYTSKTHYVHIGEDKAFRPMFKKEIWRGQSNLASIKGRQVPLAEWPSFVVPMIPILSLATILPFIILNWIVLAGASVLMTFLPVVVYALRLKLLVKDKVGLIHCLAFYAAYFPARAIGTVIGLFSGISTSSHK